MSLELIRDLYDYHRWANRTLFDHVLTLGDEAATRDMGPQWSFPTVLRMFGHIYGADVVWLGRWRGAPPPAFPGGDIPTMGALRVAWDVFETEQGAYIGALSEADVARVVDYKNLSGLPQRAPLWKLVQHIANHATHHRSEISTMVTLISGSPPDTGVNSHILAASRR
jgi:uncharacterized damage-inducible protein DinB